MRKFFTSFASPKMVSALHRISRQSASTQMFDEVIPYELDDLAPEFRSTFKDKLSEDIRGFGYWSWKAQVVQQTLAKMNDGDQLLYADAGCHINSYGKQRLQEYFDMLSDERPFVIFQQDPDDSVFGETNPKISNWPNKNWIKGDLIDHFGIRDRDDILSQQTYYATTFLLQKNDTTVKFVNDWLELIKTNWKFIDDSPSVAPDLPSFIEHRHDQSIFSVQCHFYPINVVSACEIAYPKIKGRGGDWARLKNFPIHARRDRRDKFSSRVKGVRIDISRRLQHLFMR